MCSIMGFCGSGITGDRFRQSFDKTVSRGPDDTRILDTGRGILGFHRLAIMGLHPEGMQPFTLDGSALVCNGEIYGFEKIRDELKKKYTFVSGSDCEILLPMYREYGVGMFDMLDAEYALILYDAETGEFIAARDPIGIRPLYYGYAEGGEIVFASEPKNLVGLCETVMPFPPGHYYKGGEFIPYCKIYETKEYTGDSIEAVCRNIHDKLVCGIEKRLVADAKVGFLLSGGLDSSLVCAVAQRKSKTPIKTFAIGMEKDAIDLKYAKQVAEYIGSEHTEVYMTKKQVLETLDELIQILGTYE
ncbi:MAG: asparagine synthase-related protein, partial [Clostridia bacterium]|nr:asparagine synthase-related protein [Clostridia bacterium]